MTTAGWPARTSLRNGRRAYHQIRSAPDDKAAPVGEANFDRTPRHRREGMADLYTVRVVMPSASSGHRVGPVKFYNGLRPSRTPWRIIKQFMIQAEPSARVRRRRRHRLRIIVVEFDDDRSQCRSSTSRPAGADAGHQSPFAGLRRGMDAYGTITALGHCAHHHRAGRPAVGRPMMATLRSAFGSWSVTCFRAEHRALSPKLEARPVRPTFGDLDVVLVELFRDFLFGSRLLQE